MARHHRTREELEAGLGEIEASPKDGGVLEMIVRRPEVDAREELEAGELSLELGLVGDTWKRRGSSSTGDGSGHPEMQITMMSSRVIALIAGDRDRWQLAGDQLYVDLDLSDENLPRGSRLRIGEAVIEITEIPHTGCDKFARRFGVESLRFVNSPEGRGRRLRGVHAKVLQPGLLRVGDVVTKETI